MTNAINTLKLYCPNQAALIDLAQALAPLCKPPCVMTLQGDIGAGKTTMVRAMLQQLGITGAIKSPTFALVEPYELADVDIYHIDLYRLAEEEELAYLGIRDFVTDRAMLFIEWPERAQRLLPPAQLSCVFGFQHPGRTLQLTATTATSREWLYVLQQHLQQHPVIDILASS